MARVARSDQRASRQGKEPGPYSREMRSHWRITVEKQEGQCEAQHKGPCSQVSLSSTWDTHDGRKEQTPTKCSLPHVHRREDKRTHVRTHRNIKHGFEKEEFLLKILGSCMQKLWRDMETNETLVLALNTDEVWREVSAWWGTHWGGIKGVINVGWWEQRQLSDLSLSKGWWLLGDRKSRGKSLLFILFYFKGNLFKNFTEDTS